MSDLQRTDKWKLDRAGKFTGSRFADLLARSKPDKEGKTKPLKAHHDLMLDLATERFTGSPIEGPTGLALAWGTDVEPFALEAYELETGNVVNESGFIVHPEFDFVGCSPDGLIGDKGGLEIKSPKSPRVHLERLLDQKVPEEYVPQVQGCMWVTGREWWDFVSFDPRMPESHQILIIRVERDEKFIEHLKAEVLAAEVKVQELVNQLMKKVA
jgi:predicted phage-related endonuclease